MKKALFFEQAANGSVRCLLCPHACLIGDGQTGICRVRVNRDGVLYSLNYGCLAAMNLDPVEKKPLYHFLPSSSTMSIAGLGCNLKCRFCQNSSLSIDFSAPTGEEISPAQVLEAALQAGAASLSYTYSEPTVFIEMILETSRLARRAGLANILVSNGYISAEAGRELFPLLDAANIDLKSFSEDFYRDYCRGGLEPVLATIRSLAAGAVWLELTTLVIPGLNDSPGEADKIARFIAAISPDIPWHISRFFPHHELCDLPPTPERTVSDFIEVGRGQGLRYLYAGNSNLIEATETRCPQCSELLVLRRGYQSRVFFKSPGICPVCTLRIPGAWR